MKRTCFMFLISAFAILGCQSFRFGANTRGTELTPQVRAEYRQKIDKAWALLDSGELELAFKEFKDFNQQHPQTIFESEVLLGQGTALSQMHEWSLASSVFHELLGKRLASHPRIAAMAFYEQSKVAEALGNENEMLASLLDAEKNSGDLPEEIRIAALPARRALAEIKMGQKDEAKKSLARAEQGVAVLKNRGTAPQVWAQIYFEMGTLATNQMSLENFQAHLDSFNRGQIFLLGAIESGALPWSKRALESLQGHYRDFWNVATHPQVSRSLDQAAQEREKAELTRKGVGQIGILVSGLRKYQKPGEKPPSEEEKALADFLTTLEGQIAEQLNQSEMGLPVTPESKKRNRLKKEGWVISEPLFPNEKKSGPSDPNLGK